MRKIGLISDTINKDDINALCQWLQQEETPQLTKGRLTVELEGQWAQEIGTKYSVFVNSGSSAIFLALMALKETIPDRPLRVVVPALSWATDLSSPLILGCDVKLCDCNREDLSCELSNLEYIFSTWHPHCLISVSPLGLIPNMEELTNLCDLYGVLLIEDNCESMGSRIGERMLGSYGEMSLFSMYYGHHLSSIEGGFVNTNDSALYNLLLAQRSHGWSRDMEIEERNSLRNQWKGDAFSELYTFFFEGMNLRSTDLQAFIGLRMLERLEEYSLIRNINFFLYNMAIKNNELMPRERMGEFVSNFAYPMLHKRRKEIVADLIRNGVETRPLIAGSMGKQPLWIKKYGKQSYPNADYIHEFGFYLPNHQNLEEEDVDYIADIINKY